mmetsp:Transcript_15569/g.23585  ORF Transcript_15569/g.23585 Transcript_15569/m.23585 type:complete len:120 (+) Transcript_15569:1386-1745(+)
MMTFHYGKCAQASAHESMLGINQITIFGIVHGQMKLCPSMKESNEGSIKFQNQLAKSSKKESVSQKLKMHFWQQLVPLTRSGRNSLKLLLVRNDGSSYLFRTIPQTAVSDATSPMRRRA